MDRTALPIGIHATGGIAMSGTFKIYNPRGQSKSFLAFFLDGPDRPALGLSGHSPLQGRESMIESAQISAFFIRLEHFGKIIGSEAND
jgi:hypothetical protein